MTRRKVKGIFFIFLCGPCLFKGSKLFDRIKVLKVLDIIFNPVTELSITYFYSKTIDRYTLYVVDIFRLGKCAGFLPNVIENMLLH